MNETGVIARIAAILTVLQDTPRSTADVSRHLGYTRSTTYRLITELRRYRFIARDSAGLLRIGDFPVAGSMATTASVLDRLRETTGESVQLWVRVRENRVCVRTADSFHELRVSRSVGTILPLVDGGSAGLALGGPGNPQEFYSTKQARQVGVASSSVAFSVGGTLFALCVSYPIIREPANIGGAFRGLLTEAAEELRRLLEESEELNMLRDISELSVGRHVATPVRR